MVSSPIRHRHGCELCTEGALIARDTIDWIVSGSGKWTFIARTTLRVEFRVIRPSRTTTPCVRGKGHRSPDLLRRCRTSHRCGPCRTAAWFLFSAMRSLEGRSPWSRPRKLRQPHARSRPSAFDAELRRPASPAVTHSSDLRPCLLACRRGRLAFVAYMRRVRCRRLLDALREDRS